MFKFLRSSKRKYPDYNGQRLVFLHMPKTAGSFLKKSLPEDKFYGCSHNISANMAAHDFQSQILISSIRDPVTWYISAYNFKMATETGNSVKDYRDMERNSFSDFLCDMLNLNEATTNLKRWNKPWQYKPHIREMAEFVENSASVGMLGYWTLNVLYYGCKQWQYILKSNDIQTTIKTFGEKLIDVDVLVRMESLKEDLEKHFPKEVSEVNFSKFVNRTSHEHDLYEEIADFLPLINEKDGLLSKALGYEIELPNSPQ